MPRKSNVPEGERCGALTKSGNKCAHKKGYRTDHVGSGKCYLHGGKSNGAPFGNKNALVTGEYEHLHYSALTPEEQHLYDLQDAIVPKPIVEQQLRIISIREHRILLRIRRATEEEQTSPDGFEPTAINTAKGWNGTGKMDLTTTDFAPTSERIMRLESALSNVQTLKRSYIETLRGVLKETPDDSGGLEAIVRVIDSSAAKIAAAKEAS